MYVAIDNFEISVVGYLDTVLRVQLPAARIRQDMHAACAAADSLRIQRHHVKSFADHRLRVAWG